MWIKCVWIACLLGAVNATVFQDTTGDNLLQDKWGSALNPAQNTRLYFVDQPLRPLQSLQDSEIEDEVSWRGKRVRPQGPSLSVTNPIEVLRSRLLLEIARRQMKQQDANRVNTNREYLRQIGKRNTKRSSNDEKTESLDYYNSGDIDWDNA